MRSVGSDGAELREAAQVGAGVVAGQAAEAGREALPQVSFEPAAAAAAAALLARAAKRVDGQAERRWAPDRCPS